MGYKGITALRNSDLSLTDLRNFRGLAADDLAGTNLKGATLPAHIDFAPLIGRLHELSNTLQRTLLLIEATCLYTWVTMLAIDDAEFSQNETIVLLPVIGSNVEVSYFFFLSTISISLLLLYFYATFLIYCKFASTMPEVFQNGTREEANFGLTIENCALFYLREKKTKENRWKLWLIFIYNIRQFFPLITVLFAGYRYMHLSIDLMVKTQWIIISLTYFYSLYCASRAEDLFVKSRLKEQNSNEKYFDVFYSAIVLISFLVLLSLAVVLIDIVHGRREASEFII